MDSLIQHITRIFSEHYNDESNLQRAVPKMGDWERIEEEERARINPLTMEINQLLEQLSERAVTDRQLKDIQKLSEG